MKKFWGILCLCLLCTQTVWALGYSKADKFGKTAPYAAAETPETLARYFTEKLEKPADRARALAAWMVYQMDRDGYREKVIKQSAAQNKAAPKALQNDPFKTRVGTPQDYAELYQQIGKLMGLDVVVIQGYAGKSVPYSADADKSAGVVALRGLERTLGGVALNNEMQPYQSAWNAVKIDGQWKTSQDYVCVHRIAVDPQYKGKGLASIMLDQVVAMYPQYHSLRMDTHENNFSMQRLLLKYGFEFCGIITLQSGALRRAYECQINC